MTDPRRQNADLVESLGSALRDGEHGLGTVPMLLHRVLDAESWREFVTQRGDEVEHDSWAEFVATPPLKGLGSTIDMVRRIAGDDPELLRKLRDAERVGQGVRTDLLGGDSPPSDPKGQDSGLTAQRLAVRAPEEYEAVLAGEKTLHAAALSAGFRRPRVPVRLDSADSAAKTLRKHMSPEVIAQLKDLL